MTRKPSLLAIAFGLLVLSVGIKATPLTGDEKKKLVLMTTLNCTDSTRQATRGQLTAAQISDYCTCVGVKAGERISGDQVDAFNAGDPVLVKTVMEPTALQCFGEMKKKWNMR